MGNKHRNNPIENSHVERMGQLFSCGDMLYGYCNGFFGRDDYHTKECVMVCDKYAVFEYEEDGTATVLNFDKRFVALVENWKKEEK